MKKILDRFHLEYSFRVKDEKRKHRNTLLQRPMFDAELRITKGRSRPSWIFKSYWPMQARNPYLALRNGLKGDDFEKWTPKYDESV